jgi:hypothetical protein
MFLQELFHTSAGGRAANNSTSIKSKLCSSSDIFWLGKQWDQFGYDRSIVPRAHKRILLQAYSSPVLVEKEAVMFFKLRQIERVNFLKSSASQF